MLALSATSPAAMSFVSANMGSINVRHLKRLKAQQRGTPIVLRKNDEIKKLVIQYIKMIREHSGNDSQHVAFSLAIDATCVVQGYQVIKNGEYTVIVGGAHPSHSIDISNCDDNEIATHLSDCAQGKKGARAKEIKVAVVSFQNTPPGMCPYFTVGALPQSNNDVNDWGKDVIDACTSAANEAKNAVLLNEATDGVSCETSQNLRQVYAFLSGDSNVLAIVDTNHNVKNCRGQLVGGGSATSIGNHVIDPSLFKRAGVIKEVVRVADFASDALPLALASSKVVNKLFALHNEDPGTVLVSI